MNAKILRYVLPFLISINASAQEWKVDMSYKYMYSNQWDKMIQSYNFSRPFLTENQPLLMHGVNTSVSSIFKNDKRLQHGINLSYSYVGSSAENENFSNALHLHFLNLGYLLHFESNEKSNGLYSDLILSATSSGLFRRLNGEPFEYDDSKSIALGIGGDIQLKFGYRLQLKNNCSISPFVSFAYSPYLYSPNSEAVINQTKGLVSKNWTGIASTQVGLAVHIEAK